MVGSRNKAGHSPSVFISHVHWDGEMFAMQSPVLREERCYACERDVFVYLVKITPTLDVASLPRWMREKRCYDLTHEERTCGNGNL